MAGTEDLAVASHMKWIAVTWSSESWYVLQLNKSEGHEDKIKHADHPEK